MKSKAVWLLAGIIAMTVPALAQSVATDTLSALLAEVRQLRIAMERAATTTPQIQLLGTRLGIQNDRLARVDREHDVTRQELDEVSASLALLTVQMQDFESRGAQEPNLEKQRAMELAAVKRQIAELTTKEQRLRTRESELAAALSSEQNQWAELNRRLDEVERLIGTRQPR